MIVAKVRRVFQKETLSLWRHAIFYNDDMEIHPGATMKVNGDVHTMLTFTPAIASSPSQARRLMSMTGRSVSQKMRTRTVGRHPPRLAGPPVCPRPLIRICNLMASLSMTTMP